MNDTFKFAIQAIDEKLSSQIDITERKLKYQIEGFQKIVEAKMQKHADITKGEGNSIAAFTSSCQDEVDLIRRQANEMISNMRDRVTQMET